MRNSSKKGSIVGMARLVMLAGILALAITLCVGYRPRVGEGSGDQFRVPNGYPRHLPTEKFPRMGIYYVHVFCEGCNQRG